MCIFFENIGKKSLHISFEGGGGGENNKIKIMQYFLYTTITCSVHFTNQICAVRKRFQYSGTDILCKKNIFVHMMIPAHLKWLRLLMLKYEILMMM